MLQHVTLEVKPQQVRDCVAFWALLGFTEMTPPPLLRHRFVWVEREGTQIHLVPVDDPVAARDGHVAVVADDYDAKSVERQAAAILGERADSILHGPRAALGPPWTKDHRTALAAAIVAGH